MYKYVYRLQRDNVNMAYSLDLERITEFFNDVYDSLTEEYGTPIIDKKGIALFQVNVIEGTATMIEIIKEPLI